MRDSSATTSRSRQGLEKEGLLFLKKKKQKDFFNLGQWCFKRPGSSGIKVFAPLFSKSGCLLRTST
jgi:hypothetical protein